MILNSVQEELATYQCQVERGKKGMPAFWDAGTVFQTSQESKGRSRSDECEISQEKKRKCDGFLCSSPVEKHSTAGCFGTAFDKVERKLFC